MDSLCEAWDNNPLVRERLRDRHHLMRHLDPATGEETNGYVEKSVDNMKLNHFILSLVFKLMAAHDLALPNIDKILEQITKLYAKSQVTFPKHADRVYQDGWAVRRFCSLIKKQAHRPTWPKD